MAGEVIRAFGTQKTLAAAGATLLNNGIGAATTANYSTSADGADFPHAEFAISFTFGVAPTEGTSLVLLARSLLIDGVNNAQVPEATRPERMIGAFIVDNVTTLQLQTLFAYDVPRNATYYLLNSTTGQTVSVGWTLKVTPMTYKPAP
jgi:hypothetical protein